MEPETRTLVAVLFAGLVVGSGVTVLVGPALSGGFADWTPGDDGPETTPEGPDEPTDSPLDTFDNQSEYAAYVRQGQARLGTGFQAREPRRARARTTGGDGGASEPAAGQATPAPTRTPAETATEVADTGGDGDDRRVAGTNVQETGIDEPSIVKAYDGHFYYAPDGRTAPRPPREPVTRTVAPDAHPPPERDPGRTHVLNTSDAANPELAGSVNVSGKMVRAGDDLVVIGAERIYGYDVADPEDPQRLWTKPLNATLQTARMQGGELYLVTRSPADPEAGCPIEPVGPEAPVDCGDIHRPDEQVAVDATYTAVAIAPDNGTVTETAAFVGTRDETVVYMSDTSLYVTYTERTPQVEMVSEFLINVSTLVPEHVKDRLREIRSYDLSPRARQIEVSETIESWLDSKEPERRDELRKQLRDDLRDYAAEHKRQLTQTNVVRVNATGGLAVEAVGTVPGEPLNQFSLDERNGEVRIATTVPRTAGAESANDLYTLDSDSLQVTGEVTNMSPGQRIYAVRYVEDTAYLVTFRQVDPLHVVDLDDPQGPHEAGQVKLPGFSEYLHPVGEDRLLGVGEEDGRVKVTLFDVSDPANPTVADEKVLDEYWSAVSRTHHAFMHDARHDVVFLPAGDDGLVLNYANDTLRTEARVSMEAPAQRARYVGDHLYVFGPREVAVLNETTWERTSTVALAD